MEPVNDAADTTPRKRRTQHPERIKLSPDAAQRVDGWAAQLSPRVLGRRLVRADLINWLILSHDAQLTETELTALQTEFFHPIRALQWAVKEAMAKYARGEAVDVREVVNSSLPDALPNSPSRITRRRSRPTKITGQDTGVVQGADQQQKEQHEPE